MFTDRRVKRNVKVWLEALRSGATAKGMLSLRGGDTKYWVYHTDGNNASYKKLTAGIAALYGLTEDHLAALEDLYCGDVSASVKADWVEHNLLGRPKWVVGVLNLWRNVV